MEQVNGNDHMDCHRFYIYSNDDFTKKSAGTTRMIYYAKALVDKTTEVYFVSCCKDKFSDNNFDEIEPNIFLLKTDKLVRFNFYYILIFLKRFAQFTETKKKKKSFVFYPSSFIFLEILSLIYLKVFKKYHVFCELNEIRKYTSTYHDPISLKNARYSIKKIIFKITFTSIQPLLYFYDGLICISTSMVKYAKRFNRNTLRIPILTDPDYKISFSENIYHTKGTINIGFSGTIILSKENLESFIKVIARVIEDGYQITFNLCGHAPNGNLNLLQELIQRYDLNDIVKYHGNLNEKEFSTFLHQQDLLVIPRGYTIQNKYGFSTKLSDYLNHQKIILLTDINEQFVITNIS